MFVYALDVVCDCWFALDMLVSLVVVVPGGTYPGQPDNARRFSTIAQLYFRHAFARDVFPIFIYQITSQVLMSGWLDSVGHWIWCGAALPRLVLRLSRFLSYFGGIAVNPDVNIKHMQAVRIGLVIILSAHWIGCFFYFMARAWSKDDTTWLAQFEKLVPLYDRSNATVSSEYLLCIYKGFNTLTALGYDGGMPNNLIEMLLKCVVLAIQVQLSGLILGTLLNYLVRRDPVEEAHKQQLAGVHQYMMSKSIPYDLHGRVIRFFEFQYQRNRQNALTQGVQLPRSLAIKVANANYGDILERCSSNATKVSPCARTSPPKEFSTQ